MRKVFHGTLEQLDAIIRSTGSNGVWELMPRDYWCFKRHDDGAILNWWPSSGTFNFQGPGVAAMQFERSLSVSRLAGGEQ